MVADAKNDLQQVIHNCTIPLTLHPTEDTLMASPKFKRHATILFVAATLLAPAFSASAAPPECPEIGNLGRFIMEKRQSDTPKDEVRSAIYAMSYGVQPFGIVLLDEAYKVDIKINYGTRKNEIDAFALSAREGCEAIITPN